MYAQLFAAAQRGDATAMLKLAIRAPDFVPVNHDRMAMQLRSCELNALVANLAIPRTDANVRRIAMLENLQAKRLAFAAILNRVRAASASD
ncbi:MAG: hypothetical protein ACREMA_14105 [Longimicrobiales bacterium]